MKIKYSHQAEIVIRNLKHFDRADFEAWYIAQLEAGNKTLAEYLFYKESGG